MYYGLAPENMQYVVRDMPKLPLFHGMDKDTGYARWCYEVKCFVEDGNYSNHDILISVIKSLKFNSQCYDSFRRTSYIS